MKAYPLALAGVPPIMYSCTFWDKRANVSGVGTLILRGAGSANTG